MTRRRVAGLGRLSMVAGSVLMVAGLAIASPRPTAVAVAAAPSAAESVEPPLVPTSAAPATSPPADPMNTVFEDAFDFEGAWPTGELGDVVAAYEAGRYVISGPRADLPVFIAPVSEPLAGGSTVVIEADLALEPGAQAGVYVGGIDSERIGALISYDGRVTIVRDSSVSLDVIGSASVATNGPMRLTLTVDGTTVAAEVDGQHVVSVALSASALHFGLVTWPTQESAVSLARFHVMASLSG